MEKKKVGKGQIWKRKKWEIKSGKNDKNGKEKCRKNDKNGKEKSGKMEMNNDNVRG